MRWRVELSCYSYDIIYRPGKENIPPDTFSHSTCAASPKDSLYLLYQSLCHPGITRISHFVRTRNLPFSIEEIKRMTNSCRICCECKPRFHPPVKSHLIKATQPFERLNIDFKGPLPTSNKNSYFLNVIDEYSRFPFVFPCPNMNANTVIECLSLLFSVFEMPAFVHSDRGPSLISHELRTYLAEKGVATSHTTPYNPAGNGQIEKCNGTVWRAVTMACKSENLQIKYWQKVLPDVLHSIRSLLCATTNETPHECLFRFSRRSTSGSSIPTWLTSPGPVFLKCHIRTR